MNKNYYYAGTFYETEEDFHAGVKKFEESQVTEDSIQYLFNMFCKDCEMNLCVTVDECKNYQLRGFLATSFINFLDNLFRFKQNNFCIKNLRVNTSAILGNSCSQDSSLDSAATSSAAAFDKRPLC